MGWPISWSSLEPMEELAWLAWSVDPADMLPPDFIGTPRATEAVRSDRFRKGRIPSPEEYVKQWPTPRAFEGGAYRDENGNKKESGLKAIIEYGKNKGGSHGIIPRVATNIKDRVNRLKAIGNGQVPQVAALAWEILTN